MPLRQYRRALARQEVKLSKKAGTVDNIDRFRKLINPERFRGELENIKNQLIQRGESLIIDFDLTASAPINEDNERDVEVRDRTLDNYRNAINEIVRRIDEIDATLAEFDSGQDKALQRLSRSKSAANAARTIEDVAVLGEEALGEEVAEDLD